MEKWVRIISSERPTYWYSSMIGKVYKVDESSDVELCIALEGEWPEDTGPGLCFINKSDCIIINSPKDYNGEGMKHRFV